MDAPKVTFGIINCNRLHYLESCVESLLESTSDYDNKEIIIVDNASMEDGTDKYLLKKEKQGLIVHKTEKRDPNNEFAKALNFITRESTGDFIAQIQGDMQFVLKGGWLEKYTSFYSKYISHIGCIMLDAQRTTRIKNQSKFSQKLEEEYPFFFDVSRIPFCCSADVMYSRQSLEFMGPFLENNEGHEKGINSEDDMRQRLMKKLSEQQVSVFCAMPLISPAVAIFTDSRGTNARVRGNKRYGDYWKPKQDFRYYEMIEYKDAINSFSNRDLPVGIEEMARGVGWSVPIDSEGNWKKNPIRPEHASEKDFTVLYEEDKEHLKNKSLLEYNNKEYIDDWLEG